MSIRMVFLAAAAALAATPSAAEGRFNFEPAKSGVYASICGGGQFHPRQSLHRRFEP